MRPLRVSPRLRCRKTGGWLVLGVTLVLLSVLIVQSTGISRADDIQFSKHIISSDFGAAESLFPADIDSDGQLDLVTASPSHPVTWWRNTDGDAATWTAQPVPGTEIGAVWAYPIDMDGDLDQDIIAALADATVYWLENSRGDGSEWAATYVGPGSNAFVAIHPGDLDGDGDVDLAAAVTLNSQVLWWENTEDGAVWVQHQVATVWITHVKTVDMDLDGDLDILGCAYWWENSTGDGLSWERHVIDVGNQIGIVEAAVGDFDHDGDLDVAGGGLRWVAWWENLSGDGDVWVQHLLDDNYPDPNSADAADLDDDGDLDILISAAGTGDSGLIAWWENRLDEGLSWVRWTVDTQFVRASAIASADIDHDSDLDILGAARNNAASGNIAWWENPMRIHGVTVNGREVPRYEKFEINFRVSTPAQNPYLPFASTPPPGVPPETGITVNARFLAPGGTDWQTIPCFYYQPMLDVGSDETASLMPTGAPDWRCRFTPDTVGVWSYQLSVLDSQGLSETNVAQFECTDAENRGFVQTSPTDSRYFEFSNGEPFVYPLVHIEQGNPFNSLAEIEANTRLLGQNGVRFVRWFPTGEGANFDVIPYGDDMVSSWGFGTESGAGVMVDTSDRETGHLFSFVPVNFSRQSVTLLPGHYRLTVRAMITNGKQLTVSVGNLAQWTVPAAADWVTYQYGFDANLVEPAAVNVFIRGDGTDDIRINLIQLQRYEAENGQWSENLLARSDPDTYRYVDQIGAARLDRILDLSALTGVYHKLPLFHKADAVLNHFQPDGSVGDVRPLNANFYAADNRAARWYEQAYLRYFLARWGYSPAIHSVELANENNPNVCASTPVVPGCTLTPSGDAGLAFAHYVAENSARPLLATNSFSSWFYVHARAFWLDPYRGAYLDYLDRHWYAEVGGGGQSSGLWYDSAAYVRECQTYFTTLAAEWPYPQPIVRGEGGVRNPLPIGGQYTPLANDAADGSYAHKVIYYHKLLWSQIGSPGGSCHGEWFTRLFVEMDKPENAAMWQIYPAFARFLENEPLANGHYRRIGSDLSGAVQISVDNPSSAYLRAWGVQDEVTGNTLVWVDNATDTWSGSLGIHPTGLTHMAVSGDLILKGFQPGKTYVIEWWDTYGTDSAQPIIERTFVAGDAAGSVTVPVSQLWTDSAIKIVPFDLTVNSTTDPGDGSCTVTECTLREAMTYANDHPGLDTIAFNISGEGPHTIQPVTPLPQITDGVIIDGYTQPGARPNTRPLGAGNDATLLVEVDGSLAGYASGLSIWVEENSVTVRGLVINRFSGCGVGMPYTEGTPQEGHIIEGNFIGTDVTGTEAAGNGTGVCISGFVVSGARIGGTTPAARNVISGNRYGVSITSEYPTGNMIQGNHIGTNADGDAAVSNRVGILFHGWMNLVGGEPGAANLIAGNETTGILVDDNDTASNVIQNNFIGVTPDLMPLGNGGNGITIEKGSVYMIGNTIQYNLGHGIALYGDRTTVTSSLIAHNHGSGIMVDGGDHLIEANTIGSDPVGFMGTQTEGITIWNGFVTVENNTIEFNGNATGGNGISVHDGEVLVTGNRIWVNSVNGIYILGGSVDVLNNVIDTNGVNGIVDLALNSRFLNNAISWNWRLGIDLLNDGVTLNDVGDADGIQNYPVLTRVELAGENTVITGRLNSVPNTAFTLELFSTSSCVDGGYGGQGKSRLGLLTVTTDSNGDAPFSLTIPEPLGQNLFVTATATGGSPGRTSEFSACKAPVVMPDTSPPVCTWTDTIGPTGQVSVQDVGSGLAVIQVIKSRNVNVVIPAFVTGTVQWVEVQVTLINPRQLGFVRLLMIDTAGNRALCNGKIIPETRHLGE